MQAALDAEFGKDSDSSEEAMEDSNSASAAPPTDDLFCPACSKLFKSTKA